MTNPSRSAMHVPHKFASWAQSVRASSEPSHLHLVWVER